MFRNACTIAREFTRPVILCRQSIGGACTSSIGSFVVVNDEGWIVTAGHIIDQLRTLVDEETANANQQDAIDRIRADATLTKKEQYGRIKALGKLTPDSTRRAGVKWGYTECALADAQRHPVVDLAIGRLDPFDPAWIKTYPALKDPAKDFEPGASLCKYGFPFHSVTPTWDAASDRFKIGADPLPMFPIEGIMTRTIDAASSGHASPYPLRLVETSSPGLRGQSGGPTFDVHGAIWGIQSQTNHLALGFNPPVPGARNGETEHQFLNVGWGIHSETVIGALSELGVKHSVSAF